MRNIKLYLLLALCLPVMALAQPKPGAKPAPPQKAAPPKAAQAPSKPAAPARVYDPNKPEDMAEMKFNAGNYEDALLEYLKLLEKDEKNALFNLRIGICYLETNVDKSKAKTFLEYVCNTPGHDPVADFYLARAYGVTSEFDKAIEQYKKLQAIEHLPLTLDAKVIQREMDWNTNAKDIIKYPVNVTFENLGKNINSPFADYGPFISMDENFIMFNSMRPDNSVKRADGKYAPNVYISTVKDGKWLPADDIGENVNTEKGSEEIVGVCADGNTLIFNFNNSEVNGDVFVGPKYGNEILKPFKVNPNINDAKSIESSASISPDGKTLYFASDRKGGFGGFDIYRSRILPNGEWGQAYNLGPNINTAYDENFPNISFDGYTVYFSSKGHNSMGGYDIFKAEILEDTLNFGPAKNLGYPINTPMDDKNLCMSAKGRYGYLSTQRKDSQGDLDIYRVVFNGVDAELTVVSGLVKSHNPGKTVPASTLIEVFETKSNNTFGTYKINPNTGKYVMILPPGKYYMEVRAQGFKAYSENLEILDKGSFQPTISKDISILSE